jgi:hypothetical protein
MDYDRMPSAPGSVGVADAERVTTSHRGCGAEE